MSAERPPMNRRHFIHVLAASGAALVATGLPGAKAAPAPKAAAPKPSKPLAAAMQKEIRNQERSVADMMKVIRAYELPPGSDPAFTFRAMRARRGGR